MEAVEILRWLLVWVVYLFVQSFIINGIHTAAEGETEKYPDGTDKDSEMIFYPFKKWIMQYKMRPIQYIGSSFDELWEGLQKQYAVLIPAELTTELHTLKTTPAILEQVIKLCEIIKREKGIDFTEHNGFIRFYKEYKFYKFSKWVRMPLVQCIKCMASFWTIFLTFVPVVWFFFGWHWWILPLEAFNILSLVYINKLIYKQ